jgi:hypothetical protein
MTRSPAWAGVKHDCYSFGAPRWHGSPLPRLTASTVFAVVGDLCDLARPVVRLVPIVIPAALCWCGCGRRHVGSHRERCDPRREYGCRGCWRECCFIPEWSCPPRCACEVRWSARRGEHVSAILRIVNASSTTTRTFNLAAGGFVSASQPVSGLNIELSSSSVTLRPERSAVVEAHCNVPVAIGEGHYEAEIDVSGSYEQFVRVVLEIVQKRPWRWLDCLRYDCEEDHCEIVQGDPPVRVRAHRWYDHFQCTSPCKVAEERPAEI